MKAFIAGLVLALTILTGTVAVSAPAYAADNDPTIKAVCKGVNDNTNGKCTSSSVSLKKALTAILKVISFIAGVAAVIMIIVSGIKYTTSGGDAQAVGGAKRTLVYAIVGLVVVALSQSIVFFVVKNLQ